MNRTDPYHPQHNCMSLFERLSEYIDKELDTSTCQEIETHIKACKPCQVCLNTLNQTINLCKRLDCDQVPETFSFKLKAFISGVMSDAPD